MDWGLLFAIFAPAWFAILLTQLASNFRVLLMMSGVIAVVWAGLFYLLPRNDCIPNHPDNACSENQLAGLAILIFLFLCAVWPFLVRAVGIGFQQVSPAPRFVRRGVELVTLLVPYGLTFVAIS